MKKEFIFQTLSPKVFALSLTGLTLISLAFIAALYLVVNPPTKKLYGTDGSPVTLAPVSFVLNVSSPDDNSLIFDSSTLLQGKTTPGATVIASFENEDLIIPVNAKGDFTATIKLQPGINIMNITAFDSAGNSKSDIRTFYYSREKI